MMARFMLSAGMLTALAAVTAVRRRALASGSPPVRAAIMISLIRRVNVLPRLASRAAFLCLIVAHLLCPDIEKPQRSVTSEDNKSAGGPSLGGFGLADAGGECPVVLIGVSGIAFEEVAGAVA